MRRLDGIRDSVDMNLDKLQEMVGEREAGMLQSMGSQRVRYDPVSNTHTQSHIYVFLENLQIDVTAHTQS